MEIDRATFLEVALEHLGRLESLHQKGSDWRQRSPALLPLTKPVLSSRWHDATFG